MKNFTQKIIFGVVCSSLFMLAGCQSDKAATTQPQTVTPSSNLTQNPADSAAYEGAISLKDASFCDKISDQKYMQDCKDEIADQKIVDEAFAKLDASLCEKLSQNKTKFDFSSKRDACKIKIEVEQKRISQQQEQESTIEKTQNLKDQIIAGGDYTRCKELTDKNFSATCELQILSNKALQTNDKSWCSKASTEETKKQCEALAS